MKVEKDKIYNYIQISQLKNLKNKIQKQSSVAQEIFDVFLKNSIFPMSKSLSEIVEIRPKQYCGTICKGSIPMKNFWSEVPKDKIAELKKIGISTNTDGYPDSFLKAKSNIPISTSYIHDCSVMYMYNEKIHTHALYHASSDSSEFYLERMLKTLMPEGITHGTIIPGDFVFFKEHQRNMQNMFRIMKDYNPQAKVTVCHDSSRYPEVVGYKGKNYEIPNKYVLKQVQNGVHISQVDDNGQNSFRIFDLRGEGTFDFISERCLKEDDILNYKKHCKSENIPKEMMDILHDKLRVQRALILKMQKAKTMEEVKSLAFYYSIDKSVAKYFEEQFLIKELQNIHTQDELINFYRKVNKLNLLETMDELRIRILLKEKEIFNP